jgi:tetratricopeptide (TPR) repeat protein
MKSRWAFGMLVGISVMSGCATQPRVPAASSHTASGHAESNDTTVHHTGPIIERDEKNLKRVHEAMLMILAGQAQTAIDDVLAPIIAAYESAYADTESRIYSASDMRHARRYLVDGKKANARANTPERPILVIGSAWAAAHWAEGYAYNSMAQYAKAKRELEKALALSPENSKYTSELGFAYFKENNWTKALDLYKKAEQDSNLAPPSNTHVRCVALHGKGSILEAMRQLDAATAAYQACLKLDPADRMSRDELTYIRDLRHGRSWSPPATFITGAGGKIIKSPRPVQPDVAHPAPAGAKAH